MNTRYETLLPEIEQAIARDKAEGRFGKRAFAEANALRRRPDRDKNTLLRPAFVRDCDKILHLPVYNRYNDKTQVFSFYQNDDLSRRGLHVQLVSRIARSIGRLLGLNTDLIEAMALGHDLGHTPFGHAGERIVDALYRDRTGRRFCHTVHSVRVLDGMFHRNLTLQTLDGILCHNGEWEQQEYRPVAAMDFAELERRMEACYTAGEAAFDQLVPATLEACVVRVSDMIAYLGKDRQDALTAHLLPDLSVFSDSAIGTQNASMINNLIVDVVNNSYGKDYLQLSETSFAALRTAKAENYRLIYHNPAAEALYDQTVAPMFAELYERLLADVRQSRRTSPVFAHHIEPLRQSAAFYDETADYGQEDPDRIVVDYLAGMTDSYFLALHAYLFPHSPHRVNLHSYFEDLA